MVRTRKSYGIPLGTGALAVFRSYDDIYDTLKDDLGLVLAEGEAIQGKKIIRTALGRIGGLARINVRYQATTTKTTTGSVVCISSKLEEALQGLPTKTYRGKNILAAYLPRKVYYR